jgi:DNA-binding XRE family transcriptional regulator
MKKLAAQRKMLGLTQFEMAKAADVLYSRLVFAETGRRHLTAAELSRIKTVLHRRMKELVTVVG